MRDVTGLKVLTWRGRAAIKRHAQLLSRFGSLALIVRREHREFYLRWDLWTGYQVLAWRFTDQRHDPLAWVDLGGPIPMPLIRRTTDTASLTMPDLPNVTKTLGKFPTLVSFLTMRSWPDSSPRVPGRLWLDPGASGFTITLIDADQCLRLKVYAATLDDALAAAEIAVGSESVQWEIDQYSADKRSEKAKKKK